MSRFGGLIRDLFNGMFDLLRRDTILSMDEFVQAVQRERCAQVEVMAKIHSPNLDSHFFGIAVYTAEIHSGMTLRFEDTAFELDGLFHWPHARKLYTITENNVTKLRIQLGHVPVRFEVLCVPGNIPITLTAENRRWLMRHPVLVE